MKTRISLAVSFVAILAVAFAYGQGAGPVLGRVDVPFKFMAGKSEMPAGKYEFVRKTGEQFLSVRSLDNKASARLIIVERIARTEETPASHAKVVFNTVGDQKTLSEFWPAGTEDGYLVQVTKQEHKHEIVKEQ